MLTATIAAAVVMGTATIKDEFVCPVMGGPVREGNKSVEYEGKLFGSCCPGCEDKFAADPKKYIKEAVEKKRLIAYSLFDPISRKRIEAKKSKAHTDYMGTRYYFESEANLKAFLKDPKKISKVPAKESMTCAVMGTKIASHSKALGGYVDHGDTRYYMCCVMCGPMMVKNPEKYASKIGAAPKALIIAAK